MNFHLSENPEALESLDPNQLMQHFKSIFSKSGKSPHVENIFNSQIPMLTKALQTMVETPDDTTIKILR